jgi:signal transduction histidine kinase
VTKADSRSELAEVVTELREHGADAPAEQLEKVVEQLQESAAFDTMLLAAVDSLTEGLAIVDMQGRILFVNAEGQRLVGEVKYEAGPQEWSTEFGLYRPDGITPFPMDQNPMVLALQGKVAKDAVMLVRNDALGGEGVLLNVSAAPVFGGTEQLGAVDVFRDITEESKAQRALEDALAELTAVDESRRDFVAVASHELRAPAATAVVAMTLLRQRWGSLDDAAKLDLVGSMEGVARRMLGMVDDLLTTSKLDLGAMEVRTAPVVLAEVITAARTDVLAHDLEVVCDPGITVRADASHTHRMLSNYLTNALKYGAAPLTLSVEQTARQAIVRVVDAGDGVPDAFVGKLFSRFARAGVAGTEGSGLGLAIVQGLARANGGEAWYEPVTPHGSCFAFSLPLAS